MIRDPARDTPPDPEAEPPTVVDSGGSPPAGQAQPLKYNELVGLCMTLNARIDTLWQRVIYSHAAMVGIMVFFASTQHAFVVPRFLVVFFYSMNALVTFAAFRDAYLGLRAAVHDLRAITDHTGHVHDWISAQNFDAHARRRALILVTLWLVISYLILYPVVFIWAGH